MFTKRILAAAIFTLVVACSSNPEPETAASTSAGRNDDVITAAELNDPTIAGSDALSAVQRLRPRFLQTRGQMSAKYATTAGTVHVSLDGGPLLTVDALGRYSAQQLMEIRYINAIDAAQRWGTAAGSGAVLTVKSK